MVLSISGCKKETVDPKADEPKEWIIKVSNVNNRNGYDLKLDADNKVSYYSGAFEYKYPATGSCQITIRFNTSNQFHNSSFNMEIYRDNDLMYREYGRSGATTDIGLHQKPL